MQRYDIAIIGTGPAGLEAAITAKVRNKSVLLIGSRNLSTKVEKAHTIQNYLGLPKVTGQQMYQAFNQHLSEMNIEITQDRISAVYAMGKYFVLQGHGGDYEASAVILAVGMSVAKPFEGELENLGRGVSYCATCDASLYRGKTAVIVGYSAEDEREATFLAEIANKVTYLPQYPEDVRLASDKIEVISKQKIVSISRDNDKTILITESMSLISDGVFILREQVAPTQLVPGLAVENNHVPVDRNMATNIKGLFACGDITGTPYQYIKAAGEGNVAALSAVQYLSQI
ncbi:MAG: NAD(P)/FAD-dependent oxidoreductase [Pseudobutyrivibrio sp.]|nr:NAD(P)/FAD-dependent oxidoreductase [Pseudobutyrivibrio sp.]